ncbi:MAG: hypothetical protein KJ771_03215, partial [Nanoarchaeota archaeon]|nr:hypothetical protein [Nanoarchaeota archaeon]
MKTTTIIIVLLLTLPILTLADTPPSLTDFQQFYGTVSEMPSGTYYLRAKVGTITYNTAIATDSKFGYTEVFKVNGTTGDEIEFFVYAFGSEGTPAGTTTLIGGAVSSITLVYNSTGAVTTTDTTATSTTTGTTGGSSSSSSGITGTENLPPGQCRMNWECRLWSDCLNSQQSRICIRIDQCDQLQALDLVNFTISMPKPDETRACQVATTPSVASNRICAAGSKRCLGTQVQQCASTGESWNTLQSC